MGSDDDALLLLTRPAATRPLPELRVRGHCLEQADGAHWTAIECSDFNILNRWQHGEDIGPVLRQRADCGFNLLRVWTDYDIPLIGTFRDLDYSRIPAFVALCASHGLYVELTAYTGPYQVFATFTQALHWTSLGAVAQRCTPRPLLELVNENDIPINRIETSLFQPIAGVLCSHGSNGSEQPPVEPFWDYATFHTNGASGEQRKVGHNAWECWAGPMLTNETSRYPEVGMWRGADRARQCDLAFDSAAGAALLCAGACFHSVQGKTSILWDVDTETVARAWVAGAQSVDLSQQDMPYERLPPGPYLRVYRRGTCTVEIRP